MDYSTGLNNKNYNPHSHHHHHHHHLQPAGGAAGGGGSPQLTAVGNVKSEEAAMTSPLTGFGVSAAGVNLSVNIGVNITGVPESASAPWATAAAYSSRYTPSASSSGLLGLYKSKSIFLNFFFKLI